jgi:hypothetical protein
MNKNRIAIWVGVAGAVVWAILSVASKGKIPGGAQGGVAGGVIGYALAWLVLAFIPSKKKDQ